MDKPDPKNPDHVKTALLSPMHWGWFVTGGKYLPYPHVDYLNSQIYDAIVEKDGDLLMEAHPRSGKSMLVSRFTSGWFLGTHPDKSVLHASWKVAQSKKWGRRVRKDLEAWAPLVFGIEVSRDVRSADRFEIAGREGAFLATGATGGVQGEPADLMVTDDLVKGYEAVRSEVQLDNLGEFCTSDLETRREEGCVHISIETPWHELDPHGVWRATFPKRYRTVRLRALAEDDDPMGRKRGEPLCVERVSLRRLYELREAKPTLWNALYQCRPTAEEGGIWKRAWWATRTFELETKPQGRYLRFSDGYLVPLSSCIRYVVVDLATTEKKSADFTAIGAFALTPENPRRMAILDVDLRRMEGPEISPSVARMLARWGGSFAYYEVGGMQTMGAQYARRDGIPVRTVGRANDCDVKVSGDKTAVAYEATPFAAAGRMWVPAHAPWMAEWEHQLLTFPNAAHDDAEDMTSWACHVAVQIPSESLVFAEVREGPSKAVEDPDDEFDQVPDDGMTLTDIGSW